MDKIKTAVTELLDIKYPIIGAPMFLVSNEDMVVEISEAGGIGTYPSLNYRPPEKYLESLKNIKSRTKKPIGVNLIVNKSNPRREIDLKHSLDQGVELFVTSLGNPKQVIKEAHKNGAKVFCDVTNLEHAKKVEGMGADAVIAVGTGAGGHAGPISPFTLIPWIKRELGIPVVAAGGIADGQTMAAALCLGAEAVHVGTRFIASTEAQVGDRYKNAILKASPEDIVLSDKISGTPCNFINSEYFEKSSKNLPLPIRYLKKNKFTKKYVQSALYLLGTKSLTDSVGKVNRKEVWCAGQTVGLIHEVDSCKAIVEQMIKEFYQTSKTMGDFSSNS